MPCQSRGKDVYIPVFRFSGAYVNQIPEILHFMVYSVFYVHQRIPEFLQVLHADGYPF